MGLLRLFYALSVMLDHIDCEYLISPMYAVSGFYIISGFYMSLILNEKYNEPSLNLLFYKRRFMRLLPTYWLLAIFHLVIALNYYYCGENNFLFFDFKNFPDNASFTTYLYIIFSNLFVIGQDMGLFLGISPEDGNLFFSTLSYAEDYPLPRFMLIPVAWSISLEFVFYIIAPFILRKKPQIVLVLFVLSIASNLITNYYGLNNHNWRFRFFPSTLAFFLTGYFSYILYNKYKYNRYIASSLKLKILIAVGIIILLLLVLKVNMSYTIHVLFLFIINLLSIPFLFLSFKTNRIDRIIGELSYPLYLIHPIFIGINDLFNIGNKALIVIGALIGSLLCYKYYIKPLERKRAKIQ